MLAGEGDWLKVLDFGLAKRLGADSDEITFTGIVPGTPLYMSPEAVRCESVGPRGDLYSVGCILFELLTGASPFAGDSAAMVLVRQLDDAPPALPDSVPAQLRDLIASLLAKVIADRPASAAEVHGRLQAILAAC
jgi:serine/threonine protein kinase